MNELEMDQAYIDEINRLHKVNEGLAEALAAKQSLLVAATDERDSLRETNAELLAALKLAANELNIIRARDGAPQHIDWDRGRPIQSDGCTQEWWNDLTEQCFSAITKAEEARALLRSIEGE